MTYPLRSGCQQRHGAGRGLVTTACDFATTAEDCATTTEDCAKTAEDFAAATI
jgi:hypothetical protein